MPIIKFEPTSESLDFRKPAQFFLFSNNNLLFCFCPFDACPEFFGNKAYRRICAVIFYKCRRIKRNLLIVYRSGFGAYGDKNSYIFACFKVLALYCTSCLSPFHSTAAPRFSATNRAGSIVLSFTIFGATSFAFTVPNTSAETSPIVSII